MKYPIWSTECPSCKTGRVILFTKGGTAQCMTCGKEFDTDYEEHPELETPETEYWLTHPKEEQK